MSDDNPATDAEPQPPPAEPPAPAPAEPAAPTPEPVIVEPQKEPSFATWTKEEKDALYAKIEGIAKPTEKPAAKPEPKPEPGPAAKPKPKRGLRFKQRRK